MSRRPCQAGFLPLSEANASEIYIIPKVVVDSAYVLYNQHHSVLEHSSEIVGQLKSLIPRRGGQIIIQ